MQLSVPQKHLGPRSFFVCALSINLLLILSIDMYVPALPSMQRAFDVSAANLNLTVFVFFAFCAVGVVLAGFLAGDPTITLASVTALSVGIAIQNVPEGAIVSLPLATNGLSRPRAFLAGTLCGAVEPLGAAIMVAITGLVTPLLPVVLAFAAGAMMYVVTEELIPQTQQGHHTNIGTIGVAFGFVLMMVLDVALG